MTRLLRAIVTNMSMYEAVLPYNLNWSRRNWKAFTMFLSKTPIQLIDVGARGGSLEEIDSLRPFIAYTGFDADVEEAERLSAKGGNGFHSFKVFPYLLSEKDGPQSFNLYKNLGDSSQLLPNPDFVAFSSNFGVARTVEVSGTTLDTLFTRGDLQDVDFLKLDTQGTEFSILSAAQIALSKALMIEAEVEFIEMYKNQPLFHEICNLMYSKGFILLYLNRAFIGRHLFRGPSRGQMIFGDALFGVKDEIAQTLPVEKKLKYIALLIQYGIIDFAHHLYSSDEEARRIAPDLESVFRENAYGSLWSKIKRFSFIQLDKLIAIVLHLRGTNQLSCDSDRSWPIR
jgi:FkbM family methyltransferase